MIKEEQQLYNHHQSAAMLVTADYHLSNSDVDDVLPRRDLLSRQPGQHVSLGSLPLHLLADYRGPGLEWRRFLSICSPGGEPLFLFDIGQAGRLVYVRAYTERREAVGVPWELRIYRPDEATLLLEGEISFVGSERPRVLPSSLHRHQSLTYRISVAQ